MSLGTAPVSPMKPAKIIDVAGLAPPLPAESDPPMSVTTPVVAAPPVVVEHVQLDPMVEHAVPPPVEIYAERDGSMTSAASASAVEYVAPAPAVPAPVVPSSAPEPAMAEQTLDMFRALDPDNMTKQQLDTPIKMVLQYSKQFKSTLEGVQEVYDLSKEGAAGLCLLFVATT